MGTYEPRDLGQDEAQVDLLAFNTFKITMVGAVAFIGACLLVMLH